MFNNQSKNNNTMDVHFLYGACCVAGRNFQHFCSIDFTSFNLISRDYEQNNNSRDRVNALCTDQI